MCLQRECINKIWGTTTSENVYIRINGNSFYGNVEGNGDWHVHLPKMDAGDPYEMEIVCDKGLKKYSDIYIGEVYLLFLFVI